MNNQGRNTASVTPPVPPEVDTIYSYQSEYIQYVPPNTTTNLRPCIYIFVFSLWFWSFLPLFLSLMPDIYNYLRPIASFPSLIQITTQTSIPMALLYLWRPSAQWPLNIKVMILIILTPTTRGSGAAAVACYAPWGHWACHRSLSHGHWHQPCCQPWTIWSGNLRSTAWSLKDAYNLYTVSFYFYFFISSLLCHLLLPPPLLSFCMHLGGWPYTAHVFLCFIIIYSSIYLFCFMFFIYFIIYCLHLCIYSPIYSTAVIWDSIWQRIPHLRFPVPNDHPARVCLTDGIATCFGLWFSVPGLIHHHPSAGDNTERDYY